jgi:hypothetical protein
LISSICPVSGSNLEARAKRRSGGPSTGLELSSEAARQRRRLDRLRNGLTSAHDSQSLRQQRK